MTDIQQTEDAFSVNLYSKRGITLVRGKDTFVWDSNGKRYIDCTSGQGVAIVGHANPFVAKAIKKQSRRLITCTGSFYNDQRARLMQKLVEISPAGLEKVFFCNSGTESVEAALKFARLSTGKTDFVCAVNSFHGRTMGALSATYNPNYRNDFQPLVPGFHFAPFNDFGRWAEKITEKTAAVIIEAVQGEGGVYIGDQDFMQKIRQLCSEKGILLIIDEVQTGFGRTGKLFACEHYNIQPDILCLSKALGGGFPIGAVLCGSAIVLKPGKHGTTFGGNPLACAAAIAAIDFVIRQDLPGQAVKKGTYFVDRVSQGIPDVVQEIRQLGLMIGIELKTEAKPFIDKLQERGVLVLPTGMNIIRLLPPLTIGYKLLDEVAEKLMEVLNEIKSY
jgi:acetylornithine/LysW-gamma-L-lysine aminotransferase